MSAHKERQIPFTEELFEDIEKLRREDNRAFKWQAATLLEEAVAARKNLATAQDGA